MAVSTICADTGNGGTFTVSAVVDANGDADTAVAAFFTNLKVKDITFPEEALERIECSDLSTSVYRQYIPSDLTDPPQVTLLANFNTFYEVPYVGQRLGTATVTFPLRPGEDTAATYAGTAYVGSVTRPRLANGTIQEITLRIDFDGATGPTYTPST